MDFIVLNISRSISQKAKLEVKQFQAAIESHGQFLHALHFSNFTQIFAWWVSQDKFTELHFVLKQQPPHLVMFIGGEAGLLLDDVAEESCQSDFEWLCEWRTVLSLSGLGMLWVVCRWWNHSVMNLIVINSKLASIIIFGNFSVKGFWGARDPSSE